MKSLISLFCIIISGYCIYGQQVNVTFNVNMSNVDEDPAGVHLAGDFNDWNPASIPMINLGAGMWTVNVMVDENTSQEYKFYNGNTVAAAEVLSNSPCATVDENRIISVGTSTLATPAYCFNQCAVCGSAMIQFRVDMSLQNVNPSGVHVAGAFQGWNPGASPLDDADGDDIYIRNFTISPGTYNYKFVNGNVWGQEEIAIPADCSNTGMAGGNRTIEVEADQDMILEAVCYNSCTVCASDVMVTFQVDMSNEDVSPNGVHIVGEFQDWIPGADMMTDDDMDNIYEITIEMPTGTYEYKYLNGNDWVGPDNEEEEVPESCAINDNRIVTVPDDLVLDPVCFSECDWPCEELLSDEDIVFKVNMNDESISPNGVWLIASFTLPSFHEGAIEMTDVDMDGIFETEVTVSGPEVINYKFTNGDPFPNGSIDSSVEEDQDFLSEGCGIADGDGGWFRTYERDGNGQQLDVVCFNSCEDCAIGIDENVIAYALQVYPVPSSDYLEISFAEGNHQHRITIRDLSGRLVFSQNNVSSTLWRSKDLNLESGSYILSIENEQFQMHSQIVQFID